jgi:hypothetical protein
MALAGSGAVAIWHDIAPDGRDAFYAWHGEEHMPERVAIPGFLRGRRYVAIEGAPEFFNLYETATPAVLTGPDYLARLNSPTPRTLAAVRHFGNVARALCEVAASYGDGQGGLIATYRYDVDDLRAASHRARMADALGSCARKDGIAGAHLLVALTEASAVETEERKARGSATLVPSWIVLIEGWSDVEPFAAFARSFAKNEAFAEAITPPDWTVYRLQNAR